MKVIGYAPISFKGNKSDLSFVKRIRDIDVQVLDSLQKDKIEILLKLREATKVAEAYKETIGELINHNLEKYSVNAKMDLAEMENYIEILKIKLREINLKILAEEEKNY